MAGRDKKDRLRVLITTSTFPTREGDGQARFVLDLAEALSEHVDVTVLAPHGPGLPTRERIGRVWVRRFRYFLPTSAQTLAYGAGMRDNLRQNWLARIQMPFFLIAQTLATGWTLFRARADAINSHWLVPQGLTSALVAKITRTPLILQVHAADIYFLARFAWGGKVARFVVSKSSTVFADGSHVRKALDDLLGYPSGAILRPMGVWAEKFNDPTPDKSRSPELPAEYVMFVGRLVEKKGAEFLIRAMPAVREQAPRTEVVMVGAGPLETNLKATCSELGLSEVVHFVGPKPHSEVIRLMRYAEVVCVPSIVDSHGETEGMPTVVLEALATGVPVVGSEVDGIPDILSDRVNGWLAKPKDPDDLSRAILDAVTSGEADSVAGRAQVTALEHDWTSVARQYLVALEGDVS